MPYQYSRFLPVILFFLEFLFCIQTTSAHITLVDGTIKATQHTEPGDDPGVGEVSQLVFMFEDRDKKLDLTQRNCNLIVSKESAILLSGEVTNIQDITLKNSSFSFPYVFTEKGIYTVVVQGESTINKFQKFHFTFDIRVARESVSLGTFISKHVHMQHMRHIFIFGGGFIVGFALMYRNKYKRKTNVIIK